LSKTGDPTGKGLQMTKRRIIAILTLLLVMVVEYQICNWTQNYGADKDVVSHVGFAGTIVSIVLAVIAILYSYFQTFAQQRDAGALTKRLEELGTVSQSLSAAAERNTEQTQHLASIRTQIQEQLTASKRAEGLLGDIRMTMEAFKTRNELAEPPRPATEQSQKQAEAAFNPAKLASYLLSVASPLQITIYVAICYAAEHRMSPTAYGDLVRESADRSLSKGDTQPKVREILSHWYAGMANGYLGLLEDLKLAGREWTTKEQRELVVEVHSPFPEAVRERRAKIGEPEEDSLLAALEHVIAARDATT
jgi:hypothetical protein